MTTGRVGFAPVLLLALLVAPVLAGLAGTLGPAFGLMPGMARSDLTLEPWRRLVEWPGLWPAVRLSLLTGIGATVLSLAITLLLVASLHGTRAFHLVARSLSPLLAVPHAAAAMGLAFLIAPSGWIARVLSPWATGWLVPPDLLILRDPAGIAMMAGLVIKEVPFLLLMVLAALAQAQGTARATLASSLGYGHAVGWIKAVLPAIWRQTRLPVMAVLAYSMTSVDVAMILGPVLPPPLSVQVVVWMNHADLGYRLQAAAAAVLQLGLVLAALTALIVVEHVVGWCGRRWVLQGGRGLWLDRPMRGLAVGAAGLVVGSIGVGVLAMALWSVARLWPFPAMLPQVYSAQVWSGQADALLQGAVTTLLIGVPATGLAVALTIAALQHETARGLTGAGRLLWVLYLPLLVPQVAFLPGLQWLTLAAGWHGSVGLVAAVHGVFVLPYVFLSLAGPWRSWDNRAAMVAASLGAGPARVLWRVRLPMLLRPVLTAMAVGLAVSFGQYLPTLLTGGGRVSTITTEAVALASGANRRIGSAYGLMQMLLPLMVFALAHWIPALLFRHRRGMAEAA